MTLHRGLVVLGLVVTLAFGYLSVRDVHAGEAWDALRSSNFWCLIPAFGLLAFAVFLRAVRWRSLFSPATRPPLGQVIHALLVGYLFNNILPARAGEAARVVGLNRTSEGSRAEAFGTIMVERAYDMLVLVAILFIISPALPHTPWLGAATIFAGLLAVGLGTAIFVVARWGARPLRLILRPLHKFFEAERVVRAADNITSGLVGLHHPATALIALAWTTLSWVVLALSSWSLMLGFDMNLSRSDSLLAAMLVVIATNLAMILPSSPAAVGVFEAATIAALAVFDVPRSTALSYALVLHALNFFPYLVAGGFSLHRYRTPLRPGKTDVLRQPP